MFLLEMKTRWISGWVKTSPKKTGFAEFNRFKFLFSPGKRSIYILNLISNLKPQ